MGVGVIYRPWPQERIHYEIYRPDRDKQWQLICTALVEKFCLTFRYFKCSIKEETKDKERCIKMKMPHSPFATRLSGSAKETELRLRNIFQWKKKRPPIIFIAAAILVAVGCGSLIGFTGADVAAEDDPMSGPSLQEEETVSAPVPVSAVDATQEVLSYVDAVFALGDPNLWCFLLPATGPISAPMDEYYQEVRSLFAQRTWVRQDGPAPEREPYPDSWTIYLTSGGGITIDAGANCAWITVLSSGEPITYRTANGANDLVLSLVNLWDGPWFRYALVTLLETITDDNALARAYTDAFRELYLNSGAIADYELRSLEVLPRADEWDMEPSFQMTYAVKPADPDDPSWRYYPQAENGWVTCSAEIHLTLAGDDSQEEMIWRCGWFQ